MDNKESVKWRVYNVHPMNYTHTEDFKGEKIVIKAGEYVVMDYYDAIQFKSQYFPMKFDAMDQQDPVSYKCLKLEPDGELSSSKPVTTVYVCHFDNKQFQTLEALEAHVNTYYADKVLKDPELDKEIEVRNKTKRG